MFCLEKHAEKERKKEEVAQEECGRSTQVKLDIEIHSKHTQGVNVMMAAIFHQTI